jgi:hypothetical protein
VGTRGPIPSRRNSAILAGVLVACFASPPALILGLFWAADGPWIFEGDGVRRWLLVSGSRLDRLGLVKAIGTPVRYRVDLQEGTFPGWRIANYTSSASAGRVIEGYAARCEAMGLRVMERSPADAGNNTAPAEASLTCEIEPHITVEVHAARRPELTGTAVSVKVWGDQ